MAYIGSCDICHESTMNTRRHEECQRAFLVGIIHSIKQHLKKSPQKPLPKSLVVRVMNVNSCSVETFLKQKQEEGFRLITRATEKQLRDTARMNAMQEAGRKFDETHTDPSPITYGRADSLGQAISRRVRKIISGPPKTFG